MEEKVMKITTKTMMENTSFYKVPLKVFNKLQKAETKEEKYKIFKELPYDDWEFINEQQNSYNETEVVDWAIYIK